MIDALTELKALADVCGKLGNKNCTFLTTPETDLGTSNVVDFDEDLAQHLGNFRRVAHKISV